jgi:hypothetical protein
MKSMKVRMLKDWSFYRKGVVASVYEPTARNWLNTGIAEPVEKRSEVVVEDTTAAPKVEKAVAQHRRRGKKREDV